MSDDGTQLAVSRTLLAHDRTLMAWVRTATSMISFGFTIYKFFQFLHDQNPASDAQRLFGPWAIALVLIGIGLAGLALAAFEYRRQVTFLRQRYPSAGPYHASTALAVATMVAGLGMMGFLLVMLRQ